jgi:SAM-dependent methyltransferase/GNAT superfamily N-acetyltransferase
MWPIEKTDAEDVRALREEVLRPGQTPQQLAYPLDDAPETLHLAVKRRGSIVAVGSVMRDPHPTDPLPGDWRIRGMATRERMRGQGIGAAVLERIELHVLDREGSRLWCNARVGARALYERAGFIVEGETFEISEIGEHHLMSKQLQSSQGTPSRGERARSFGRVAAEYQRGRPGYPPEAIEWLLGSEPLEVLDLGAGTGKLTAALLQGGHRVTAVEPLDEMRSILTATLPSARALTGTAEQLPLGRGSVDAVVVGAAFHWFDQAAAQREIARVLRPPGLLGLLGNSFDTSTPWVAHLRELLGSPAIERPGHWPAVDELRQRFAEVEDREFPHAQPIDAAGLRDLALSRSRVALMGAEEQGALLAALDQLWEREPELVGLGTAMLPWRTRVRRCRGLLQPPPAVSGD